MELLKNSVAMQEQVLACKGFLVIGYTLEKVRPCKLTVSLGVAKLAEADLVPCRRREVTAGLCAC